MLSFLEVRHAGLRRTSSHMFIASAVLLKGFVIVFPNRKICRPTREHGGKANIEMEQGVESVLATEAKIRSECHAARCAVQCPNIEN